jgi:hypothetical protein
MPKNRIFSFCSLSTVESFKLVGKSLKWGETRLVCNFLLLEQLSSPKFLMKESATLSKVGLKSVSIMWRADHVMLFIIITLLVAS